MLNRLKDKIKFKLAKILAPEIDQKLAVTDKLASVTLYGIAPWYQENLWEPPVQIVLRDLCKPGDVVFDVGANFGGLATVMSRMVGPRGVVCAFEASPRIVDKTQRNLVLSGCHNTQLFHNAVYHTSGETVKIYLGSHLNDSIYSQHGEGSSYSVKTIALDDFIAHTGLVPNLLKMDIEGAEFDALRGLEHNLKTAKPHLILETQRDDSRCLDYLRDLGYVAIDLNTYQEIQSAADYPPGADIRNNLYIHRERLGETPYQPPFEIQPYAELQATDFQIQGNGAIYSQKALVLEKGRYLIDVNFTAEGRENDLMCGVKVGEKVVFRYHAYSQLLAATYRDWVIQVDETSPIQIYFEFQNGTQDPSLQIQSATLKQIRNFAALAPQLYV